MAKHWGGAWEELHVPRELTRGMLAKFGSTTTTQGAESNGLLTYLAEIVIPEHRAALTAPVWRHLVVVGESLLAMLKLLQTYKGPSPTSAIQDI